MPSTTEDSAKPASAHRVRFRGVSVPGDMLAAVLLAALWWTALLALAAFTGDPVVLNRVQIERADFIVEAVVADRNTGAVDVVREWGSPVRHDRMLVGELSETPAQNGAAYLIPIIQDADGYRIARPVLHAPRDEPLVRTPPYIYPASPQAVAQLERLLGL